MQIDHLACGYLEVPMESFASFFKSAPDPRAANACYSLSSVLFIGLAAVLCGAETCQDMADFGVSKHRLIKTLMPLPYGIPSHAVFPMFSGISTPWHSKRCLPPSQRSSQNRSRA
jgi:hypothetical protein